MSFLAAGVISEPHVSDKSGGSGILGVMAGFMLVFVLVAILSFVRVFVPRQFGSYHPYSIEQEQVRLAPRAADRYLQHDAGWIFQLPGNSGMEVRRHTCGR